MNRKKIIIAGIVFLLLLVSGIVTWNVVFSPTKIAFLNYQAITTGEIAKANDLKRVKLASVDPENLKKIGKYDMVMINGMGLRITAEQREQIQKAADKGLAVLTTMATNPDNSIVSIDSADEAAIRGYLAGGGRRNYRNMLLYIRRNIDGKTVGTPVPDAPVMRDEKQFYHIDPSHLADEELDFATLAEYNAFLKKHGLFNPDAPRVVVTGQMGDPADLIAKLEETGNVVYPVRNMHELVQSGQMDSINPSAVINMAHGRLGDFLVNCLAERNIPLFAPLNVNALVDEWEKDKMGMNGGFMSQSIVMPEIDGAIRPFVLFGHRLDKDGLQQVYAIPERLEMFVQTVNNHIALQHKPNSQKRVAIYYYKGPGQNAMTAAGMEVVESLYNLLLKMKEAGYRVENLPATPAELQARIQRQGSIFNAYANGAKAAFLKNGNPELITAADYGKWTKKAIRPEMMKEVEAQDGTFPGHYIADSKGNLALPRLVFGNVVLIPQLAAGIGSDDFAMVHGTDAAPPHAYIASYLWARYAFNADIMLHFGTHGSMEFTPRKQVALSSYDWPDALVGATPHLYVYTIGDVGEGMIAKRRSYSTLLSHLTPPFMESNLRNTYRSLTDAVQEYNTMLGKENKQGMEKASLKVKKIAVKLGIHRDLRLDSVLTKPYTEQEISRIESFAEELVNEKVTGELYTMGKPYSSERIRSSVNAMATEPIAYSLLALDKLRGKAPADLEKHKAQFTQRYLVPAQKLVARLYDGKVQVNDAFICTTAGITAQELAKARETASSFSSANDDMMSRMMAMQAAAKSNVSGSKSGMSSSRSSAKPSGHPAGIPQKGHHPSWIPKGNASSVKSLSHSSEKSSGISKGKGSMPGATSEASKADKDFARAVQELECTLCNVGKYKHNLENCPQMEFAAILNAMNGGYILPSAGGDPIVNPDAVPTGRNLYAVNAEATPSETAWERGKALVASTIKQYQDRHNDSFPRKVSYTLWSSEFIETEGATIAQVLYMLGVAPVRDVFGRVTDLRLIPSAELGRPRIDVVVQTSGQLRDIAASRLFLISRAVDMAAAVKDDKYDNFVAAGVVEAERTLIKKGVSPKNARTMSHYRVFGGVNGNYGTGITGMVEHGDRWEKSSEIADTYIQNMSAYYGSEKDWEQVPQYAFEAALTNTDAVVQPRQSNTWGALSLDHVYEFMGGLNLAVRNVTGKEPDAYMSDYRNRNNMRMQELKEAVGVESRTTVFNPNYIKEKMKGGSAAADGFADVVKNMYGWNVMKPDVIDDDQWNEIYDVYVKDRYNLGVKDYFEKQNPAAFEEMTAVMMESARKGLWNASAEQLSEIAAQHTEMVEKYKPSCSGFVCGNTKLQSFIASKTSPQAAKQYKADIREIREAQTGGNEKGVVLKREELYSSERNVKIVSNVVVGVLAAGAIVALVLIVRRRRRKMES